MFYKYISSSSLELIKYISIITMIIDHVALVLMDENEILRAIGRFAFIGFSFVLVYNYRYHTRDKDLYKKRLIIFASLSQLPYYLAFDYLALNILFLFFFSLIAIDNIKKMIKEDNTKKIFLSTLLLGTAFIASFLTSYNFFGFLFIIVLYFSLDNKIFIPGIILLIILVNLKLYNAIFSLLSLYTIYY
ncbi:MAG: hypothetical protein IE890_09775, partial [Arcobacter sp.]|nr:hypothetical protein [Arcobacter sp.]